MEVWNYVSHFKKTGNKSEKRNIFTALNKARESISRHREDEQSRFLHSNRNFNPVRTLEIIKDALMRAERFIHKMNCVAPYNHKYMEYEYEKYDKFAATSVKNFAIRELILMKDILNYYKDHQKYYCELRKSVECPSDDFICAPIDFQYYLSKMT